MDWLNANKNKNLIIAINQKIRNITENTNYNDKKEVARNSLIIRKLMRYREKLYKEGLA